MVVVGNMLFVYGMCAATVYYVLHAYHNTSYHNIHIGYVCCVMCLPTYTTHMCRLPK